MCDVPYSLAWSSSCEVAHLLSDIPPVSVAVLAFGVSGLLLVVKHRSLSAVWLLSSAFLAFLAAVVDLATLAAEGVTGVPPPAITARETLFALSIGFRFLFYWSYVAEPPRKHLPAVAAQSVWNTSIPFLESTHESHSASWTRWGLPGKLFGLGLLVVIVVITALQIVWRLVSRFRQYSGVYATDAALELLLSFLLLLKLLSNTLATESCDGTLVHTFTECLAPISGLLINIATGVGGLLSFGFTESTVGRLLQAFQAYVIIVFVVTAAFLKHRDIILASATPRDTRSGDTVFTLPDPARRSTFRLTPPYVETPRMSAIISATTQSKESSRDALRRSARRSLNQVSSWVSSKISRNCLQQGDERVKLWNAESAKINPAYTGNMETGLRASIVSSVQESNKELSEQICEAPINHLSIISALDAQSAIARSMKGSIHSGRIPHSSRADFPRRTTPPQILPTPAPSGSRRTHTRNVALGPLINPQSPASASDSRTSLDELLRQKGQLDQSIEALRMFSTTTFTDSGSSIVGSKSVELSRSPSIGQRTISDVSLSNFPVPPWSTASVPSLPSSPGLSAIKRMRGDRRVRLAAARGPAEDMCAAPVPLNASESLVDITGSPHINSVPHTPVEEEVEPLSTAPGTQYNVTSFIDDLATPKPKHGCRGKPWLCGESGMRLIGTSSDVNVVSPVPALLAQLGPLTASATARKPPDAVGHGIDEQTICPPTTPTVTTRLDGVGRGLPISSTRPPMQEIDRVQRTIIRPRPPPLIIKPYVGRNLSESSVEVLEGD